MNRDEYDALYNAAAREWERLMFGAAFSGNHVRIYGFGETEIPMQQTTAPATTYLDDLLAISTSTFDTALAAGRTQKEAYRAAMGMVAARVKDDIQRELRADRWHTAATVLDLWSAERGVPLTGGDEA